METIGLIVVPDTGSKPGDHPALWEQSIGGLPLILRQARLFRAVGISKVVLVGRSEADAGLLALLQTDRLGVSDVLFQTIEDTITNVANGDGTGGNGFLAYILLRADCVVEKSALVAAQAALTQTINPAAFVHEGVLAGLSSGRGPSIKSALRILERMGDSAANLHEEFSTTILAPHDVAGYATGDQALQSAEKTLWQHCRKPIDGIVSRNLYRPISLAVSRRLAARSITPNQISVANFLIGLAAAFLVSRGNYGSVLMGALVLQVNAVFDGVDGELARVRLQTSVLGEWLDTLSDDFSNLAVMAGLGYGAWQFSQQEIWLWLTIGTVGPLALISAVYYVRLRRLGRGDILALPWFQPADRKNQGPLGINQRLVSFGTQVFRKEVLVFAILVFAGFGVAEFCLVIVGIGAWATLGAQVFLSPSRSS